MVTRTPVPAVADKFPFGVEFQQSLLRLMLDDSRFGSAAIKYIKPGYFEHEVLSWGYNFITWYYQKYNIIPNIKVLLDVARGFDSGVREIYTATLNQVSTADKSQEQWLRDQTLQFIQRNIFVRAYKESRDFYNRGETVKAYDYMMAQMDTLYNVGWDPVDREFFFENLDQRYSDRISRDPFADAIPTGIHELDHVLGGGLHKGELGIWVAYAKRGKTTMLVNHGVQAVRRGDYRVLHGVFEGSRALVSNRYDTVFAQEEYFMVKTGQWSIETFKRLQYEYNLYHKRLVIRGFTEEWEYSVADIYDEMRDLKRTHDWVPDLIVLDYGDLLRGRGKQYRNETENQRAAFRDIKTLANRGYGIWTASQAQRPTDDIDSKSDVLQTRNIADCYDKVRVGDFLGTVNFTREEKLNFMARLFLEIYRDNAAGKVVPVKLDFSKMTITTLRAGSGVLPTPVSGAGVPLGYAKPVSPPPAQRRIPV